MAVTIKGADENIAYLREVQERINNLQPVLSEVAKELNIAIQTAFNRSTDPNTGNAWAPLKASSLSMRQSKGISGVSPLVGTGALKSSISVTATNSKISITSTSPYAGVQNYGNPRNRLFGGTAAPVPARPFLPSVSGQGIFQGTYGQILGQALRERIPKYIKTGEI